MFCEERLNYIASVIKSVSVFPVCFKSVIWSEYNWCFKSTTLLTEELLPSNLSLLIQISSICVDIEEKQTCINVILLKFKFYRKFNDYEKRVYIIQRFNGVECCDKHLIFIVKTFTGEFYIVSKSPEGIRNSQRTDSTIKVFACTMKVRLQLRQWEDSNLHLLRNQLAVCP